MAYSRPPAKTAGDAFDLTAYDAIRDSLIAGATDSFTTKGDLFVATGADAGQRVGVGSNDSILVADSSATPGVAWQLVPACRIYTSVQLDPSVGTWFTINFDSERFDTDSMHSTSSQTNRITIPSNGDGKYLIGANATLDTSTMTGGENIIWGIRILLNGTTIIARKFNEDEIGGRAEDLGFAIETLYDLSATDYLEIQIYTDEDINIPIAGSHQYDAEAYAIWQRV